MLVLSDFVHEKSGSESQLFIRLHNTNGSQCSQAGVQKR